MRKVLIVAGTLLVLSTAGLLLVPVLFKDRLVAAATAEINRQVDATVAFERADVSLLRSFPSLELSLGGVSVTGKGAFEGVSLARVGDLSVAVDVMSALSGEHLRVTSLRVTDADVHVLVDEQGRSNTDIAGSGGEPAAAPAATEPSAFALDLQDYALTDVTVLYEDRQGGMRVAVEDLDSEGSVAVASDRSAVTTKTTIKALSVQDGGVGLLREVKVAADLDVSIDGAGAITLGDNKLTLNELPLAFKGTVTPVGEDTALDVTFSAAETGFGALLSLVPAAYSKDLQGLVTSGTLALQGAVKGTLKAGAEDHLPGFDLALQVGGGSFRYPSLPTSVDGIELDMAVRHPEGGADLTEVDVKRFAMAVGGSPVTGDLRLRTPVSDPDVAAKVVGKLDLSLLAQALPPSPAKYEGRADLDLQVAGRVSQFEAQKFDEVSARGTFQLEGFRYTSPDQPVPVEIDRLLLTLDPRRADLAELSMRLGETDLDARGSVDNAVAYALTDATLVGRMDVTSKFLDLDAFAGDDGGEATPAVEKPATGASTPAPTGESSVVVIPKNLDLALNARADRVRYGGHDAKNAVGTFTVKDGALRIDQLRMELLGGTVALAGQYLAPSDEHADVDFEVELANFDVGQTIEAFETLQQLVPVARGAKGRFRTGFRMKARLGRDLSPDIPTVLSSGRLQTASLTLEPGFLADVADRLGNKSLRKLDLDDADLGFEVKDGRIRMDRTAMKLGTVAATLGGSTGALDRTLDLDLDLKLPVGEVKANEALAKLGLVKGGVADVRVKVGGTYDKPTIKLDLGSVTGALQSEAREVVNEAASRLLDEARARGDALVAEAEKQAKNLKEEAAKQADRLRAEAKKQADKLAKEAKGNPIAEAAAKEAKKKLLAEADKKIAKLEAEADKKADQGVAAAKKERERLMKEAEAKAKLP